MAKLTDSVLVDDSEIKKFAIRVDSVCCTYKGLELITTHNYLLEIETASRLSKLEIPLCCGIPVVVHVNGKEVYRAMLWNRISSFGNKSLTMALSKFTLIVANQLPGKSDNGNSSLASKNPQLNCLLHR